MTSGVKCTAIVSSIECSGDDERGTSPQVGLVLRGVKKEDIARGDIIVKTKEYESTKNRKCHS